MVVQWETSEILGSLQLYNFYRNWSILFFGPFMLVYFVIIENVIFLGSCQIKALKYVVLIGYMKGHIRGQIQLF